MSIFTKSNDKVSKPNRNTFDGRFTNNLTLKMGQITPCFCKEVMPGDSFMIDPSFGFNFMPFTHPVQTKIRANLHFFYVRNRALWRGWESFITKTENEFDDNTPPFIQLTEENRSMFETGNIGDYLGVPTVSYSSSSTLVNFELRPYVTLDGASFSERAYYLKGGVRSSSFANFFVGKELNSSSFAEYKPIMDELLTSFDGSKPPVTPFLTAGLSSNTFVTPVLYSRVFAGVEQFSFSFTSVFSQLLKSGMSTIGSSPVILTTLLYDDDHNIIDYLVVNTDGYYWLSYSGILEYASDRISASLSDSKMSFNVAVFISSVYQSTYDLSGRLPVISVDSASVAPYYPIPNSVRSLLDLPFYSTSRGDGERISALPFRAVDACYNAFYRDIRNNPFIMNGKPLYNKWVYSNQGGADTRFYGLYRANWEQDAYTTAVQSPQQGIAPLVGVTSTGRMTFQDEEGNTYTAQATFGEDGETITGISTHSSDMPVGTLRALVDTISSGISINDFRNVNAYQVWLEKNMRKGLRYKDQLEAHYGATPTYSDLQMPEFIGGMSRVVDMRAVTQTSGDSTGSPLGTLAGQASLMSEGSSISRYFDEHGFVIGFISFVPTPIYSQLLPKMLVKSDRFDYYFPEFGNIGFQPILNKELSLLQCTNEEGKRPNDVFGYQRAWYDYLSNVDEAHGEFRESMRNYIIHRTYSSVPELGSDFLTVSPNEANDVFAVTDNTDKIWGQIFFDVKMKRPIPKYGIPSLKVE